MEQKNQPLVTIVMGSISDAKKILPALDYLEGIGVSYSVHIASAHRTPDLVKKIVVESRAQVFIAAAGMAAALPGCIAALTIRPVIGLPLSSKHGHEDAVLAMLQMPPGKPVLTVGPDAAKNAAIAACQILALSNPDLALKLTDESVRMAEKVENDNMAINEAIKKLREDS